MSYEQNIVFEDNGYVGYLLQNDEVIYSTPKCHSVNAAGLRLTSYIESLKKKKTVSVEPSKTTVSSEPVRISASKANNQQRTQTATNHPQPQKRCCGRG